jgi:hypothetical protein
MEVSLLSMENWIMMADLSIMGPVQRLGSRRSKI